MRIIRGKYKFRRLKQPTKLSFSPILSSVRESIFNILNFEINWFETQVADVFCGSGILGLETLSFGASFCYFNDLSGKNIYYLQQNINKFGIKNSKVTNLPFQQFLTGCHQLMVKLDLVFLTPPYKKPEYVRDAIDLLIKYNLLNSNAVIITQLEISPDVKKYPIKLFKHKKYGRTIINFYRLQTENLAKETNKLEFNGQKLLIFSGPSGVGKKTIIQKLLKNPELNLAYSISNTTRPKRSAEKDKYDYNFLTNAEFNIRIDNNEFLEHVQYLECYYGTSHHYVQRLFDRQKNALLEVEIQGALNIKKQYPEAIWIFVYPPYLQELEQRLLKRGSETLTQIKARLKKTEEEIKLVVSNNTCDAFFVNNEINIVVPKITMFLKKQFQNHLVQKK